MLRPAVRSASLPLAVIGVLLLGCQAPEAFQISGDAGAALTLPDAGKGMGGAAPGTGGMLTGSESRDGGVTGSGGAAIAGGKGGGTDAGGNNGAGGTPTASGGAIGGTVGSGGNGGGLASAGGRLGSGGRPAASGGAIGTAGRSGTGSAGGGGSSGPGGAVGAPGPCAGVCANPTKFITQSYDPGPVGLGAACFETTADIHGGNCSNFLLRTLKVNGMLKVCNGTNWLVPLPDKKNGGYCFDISAGANASAGFQTF